MVSANTLTIGIVIIHFLQVVIKSNQFSLHTDNKRLRDIGVRPNLLGVTVPYHGGGRRKYVDKRMVLEYTHCLFIT